MFESNTSWPAVKSLLRWWWWYDGRICWATTWSCVGQFRFRFERTWSIITIGDGQFCSCSGRLDGFGCCCCGSWWRDGLGTILLPMRPGSVSDRVLRIWLIRNLSWNWMNRTSRMTKRRKMRRRRRKKKMKTLHWRRAVLAEWAVLGDRCCCCCCCYDSAVAG